MTQKLRHTRTARVALQVTTVEADRVIDVLEEESEMKKVKKPETITLPFVSIQHRIIPGIPFLDRIFPFIRYAMHPAQGGHAWEALTDYPRRGKI